MNQAQTKQRAFIEEARALLKPSPVRLHHIPNWFRRRILRGFDGRLVWGYRLTNAWSALHGAVKQLPSEYWLDHFGSTIRRGKLAFVAEPYHLSETDLASIQELARRCGCSWELDPNAWWYPGETIRVTFYEAVDSIPPIPKHGAENDGEIPN